MLMDFLMDKAFEAMESDEPVMLFIHGRNGPLCGPRCLIHRPITEDLFPEGASGRRARSTARSR